MGLSRVLSTLVSLACVLVLTGATARTSQASELVPTPDVGTQISLVTMGPGDHLFTRGGHAALSVQWMAAGELEERVYNFGDADWDDPLLAWDFLMGQLVFRLDAPGDVLSVATEYGVQQNRDVYSQRLALSPEQAERVRIRLEALNTEEARDYPHDYVFSLCTTKARDVIDEAIGGAIRQQLSPQSDGTTIREHQRRAFNGKPLAGLGADLLLGAENDVILSRYDALFVPERMRTSLQEVMIEGPSGLVPLADAPVQLAGRQIDIQGDGPTWGSWYFALALMGWLLWRAWKLRGRYTFGGLGRFGIWPAVLFGVIGCTLWGLHVLTDETGFQNNTLALAFIPLDLLLVAACRRWKRSEHAPRAAVRGYLGVRAAMAVGVLVFNLGADGSAPVALPLLALTFFGLFSWLAGLKPSDPGRAPNSARG